jgi:N-methylhydantoinase A
LADELGIAEILCPPVPGAFSALGLITTELKRDYMRTVYASTTRADPTAIEAAFAALEREGAPCSNVPGLTPAGAGSCAR